MKKHFIIAVSTLALFSSCLNRGPKKEEIVMEMNLKTDSLQHIITAKDSIINDALMTISDITVSLSDIKQREGIIISEAEIGKTSKEQIKSDLEDITAILKRNKERIAKLERASAALAKANVKIDGLTKLVAEMSRQLQERNVVITELTTNIDNLKEVISSLNKEITTISTTNQDLNTTLQAQDVSLHKAYYIVGSEKELLEKEILIKKGIVGRTLVINDKVDIKLLTEVDIRNIDRIEIKGKKVEVIGGFPSSSYSLKDGETKNEVEALVIEDKESFWENNKILVISYK